MKRNARKYVPRWDQRQEDPNTIQCRLAGKNRPPKDIQSVRPGTAPAVSNATISPSLRQNGLWSSALNTKPVSSTTNTPTSPQQAHFLTLGAPPLEASFPGLAMERPSYSCLKYLGHSVIERGLKARLWFRYKSRGSGFRALECCIVRSKRYRGLYFG